MKLKPLSNRHSGYLMLISLVLFFAGMVTGAPQWFGLCRMFDFGCYDFYRYHFSYLWWFSIFMPIPFLLGLMSWVKNKSEKVFIAWWKFARVYIPIALILIFFSDGGGALGGLGAGGGFDREITIWVTAVIFFLITFILLPLKFKTYKNA